nr:ATP-binding protein [uncultured Roseateles sp.]
MQLDMLSQNSLVTDMLRRLEGERIVGLAGLPGSGKSFTGRLLVEAWQKQGGVALTAPGDEFQRARRFFPFQHAISQFNIGRQVMLKTASGAMAKGANAIPFAGPLAGFVIEKLFAHSVEMAKERYQFLSNEEQNVLYHLQRFVGKKPLLIVCDDLQFWDEAALSLLRIMLSGKIGDAYAFLANTRFVIVQTVRSLRDAPPIEFATLTDKPVFTSSMGYVSQENLPRALAMLGMTTPLPDDALQAIHGISGGHLHVLQQLIGHLQSNPLPLGNAWTGADGAGFVSQLIVSRLKGLGPIGSDLLEVLRTACIIGTIFSDQELACLCERDAPQVRKVLSAGEGMHLVRRGDQFSHFAHGIVHESLKQGDATETEELHRQFSSCLRKLRPGDYRSRMRHLLAGGDRGGAAMLAVCGLLQDHRNGVPPVDEASLRDLAASAGLGSILDLLINAQDRIRGQDLTGAIGLLSSLDPTAPMQLQAEAAYLRALCLIKAYQYDAREESIKLLRRWINKLPDEGESRVRMLSTLLVALTHQRREDEARAIEDEIVELLSTRMAYDTDALDALRVLDRKADLLYSADQSHRRLLRSRDHFMPPADGQPRNFYQYCASTLNLAANRLVCGEYLDSLGYLRELIAFLERNPGHRFTRFEVLSNNLIVSELLQGVCDAAMARQHFEQLLDKPIAEMDAALIRSNFGACVALTSDLAAAQAILEPLYAKLQSTPEADDLHTYLAGTNLASVLYLAGDQARAIELTKTLSQISETAMPPHKVFFRDRHAILLAAMESGETYSPAEWHALPATVSPSGVGPSWRHYGRGFVFTDLQIFTES